MKLGVEEDTKIGASQAATSDIHRLAMEDELAGFSSCSSSSISLGGRAIDRCNPIIRDAARLGKVVQLTTASTKPPASPQPTTIPKHHNKYIKENTTDIQQIKKTTTTTIKSCSKKGNKITNTANGADRIANKTCSKIVAGSEDINVNNTSPGDSSRYLLTTSTTNNISSFLYSHHFDRLLTMVEQSPSTSSSSQPTFSPPSSAAADNQVSYYFSLYLFSSLTNKLA